jgi:16S rRNA (guanine527-N7)-methyltransferase
VADLDRRLAEGTAALEVPCSTEQRERLLAFLSLMQKWNRVYNLTAIRDPHDAVNLHLLDSLTVWPYLRGGRVLDTGTGAGLPGIPLAIVDEDRNFVLLDSNAKKTRFVRQAVLELGLRNVEVVTARVEKYRPDSPFDTVLARAYASLGEILAVSRTMLAPGGRILALKGRHPDGELEAVAGCGIRMHELKIPGLNVARHLVEMTID